MKKVREGYKMTELGEIPIHWGKKRLCDISEINPKKEIIEDDKNVSFIAMEDVSNEGRIIKNNVRTYGEVKKGYTAFKNNDVLLAKITPCFENGKKAIATQLINEVGFGSTEFHVLRAKKTEIIPSYIYYTISTNKFMQQAQANMTGSAGQKRVPTEFLKEYKFATPPLKEQQKIAEILSTVDEQIENTDKLIEKTKEFKKGLMQRLFTKGIGHDRFKETEIGRIPEEWELKSIGEVAKFQGGYAFKSCDFVERGIKLIKITNVQQNNLVWDDMNYLPEEFIGKYSEYKLNYNDVVMAMTRPIISTGIKVCRIKRQDVPSFLNQRVGRFIVNDKLDSGYLYQYAFCNYFINKVNELSSTTGQPNISSRQIESILIPVPEIWEQKRIALIISSVDEQIDQYETKKEKLQELKKGLMQKLLTGNIRVKV